MTSASQDQLNAGFLILCEIFQLCSIESLKYIKIVCYCGDISTPQSIRLNETNCDWLFNI